MIYFYRMPLPDDRLIAFALVDGADALAWVAPDAYADAETEAYEIAAMLTEARTDGRRAWRTSAR